MLDDRTTTFSWEDDAAAKTEKALALAERMIAWFRDNYEDPAEHTPYCTAEGGYQCELYDAREEIEGHFAADDSVSADEFEEVLDLAVAEIEADGVEEWAGYSTPPQPEGVRLLRAHDHHWGKGQVHRFEADIGKTTCGKKLENCPGDMAWGSEDDITCKACLRLIERR